VRRYVRGWELNSTVQNPLDAYAPAGMSETKRAAVDKHLEP